MNCAAVALLPKWSSNISTLRLSGEQVAGMNTQADELARVMDEGGPPKNIAATREKAYRRGDFPVEFNHRPSHERLRVCCRGTLHTAGRRNIWRGQTPCPSANSRPRI